MMNPAYDFKDQVALVTAASSGMGLATARAFAEAGAAVVLADINEEGVRTATDALTSAGHQSIGISCDVSNEAQVAAMIDRAVASLGRLDMAFNNAGIQVPPSDAADEPAENFDRVNAINLRGVWTCMKHEAQPVAARCANRCRGGIPGARIRRMVRHFCSGVDSQRDRRDAQQRLARGTANQGNAGRSCQSIASLD
jgi:NAD(P)-dependent dehydrogenase (short-subunit alcohol dehydrogenase family)